MARIRTVKPEYPKHRKVRKVSRDARLLNIHLWNLADDEGRLQELPQWIIGEVFPTDEDVTPVVLREWLGELAVAGLIVRYEVDGEAYIQCHDFTSHQAINKPRKSLIPAVSDGDGSPTGVLPEDYRGEQGTGNGTGNREQGANAPVEVEASTVRELFSLWQERCSHENAKFTDGRRRKITARLRDGYTPDDIRVAIEGAANAPFVKDGKRFDDIELVCRNGEKLELFMERGQSAVEDTPAALAARMRERQAA